jgi:hypothetical protein
MDESKKAILSKAVWNCKDIEIYCGCSRTKAYRLLNLAKDKFNGAVPLGVGYAKSDSVLALYGTSRNEEMKTYGLL